MLKFLYPLLRRLLAVAAIVVIILAIGIGALRIAMTQLPAYQSELQAWVNDELGLRLGFDSMDVRWGLRGPELTFHEVTVTAADQADPFLVARRAAVVVEPWTAITQRELRVGRLTFEGTQLTLVRDPDGGMRLQGAPIGAENRADLALVLPPEVEIGVRDSRVLYLDGRQDVRWEFQDVTVSLSRSLNALQLEARAEPPPELGSRIEVAAQSDLGSVDRTDRNWRVFGDLRDVNLQVLAAALPAVATPLPQSGSGDLSVWLEWGDDSLDRGMVEATLDDVAWMQGQGVEADGYEHIELSAEWVRAADGWRLALNDIDLTRDGRTWPGGSGSVLEWHSDAQGDTNRVTVQSEFLRLEDLTPIVTALPASTATLRWLELAPRGDFSAVDLDLSRDGDGWEYTIAGAFDGVGTAAWSHWPGFDGLSGELRADNGNGRVSFATSGAKLEWPQLFRTSIDVDELSGILVWREGFDSVRLVSDDLLLSNRDAAIRSNLELTLPLDGSAPLLDIETSVGPFQAVAAKRYLPVHKMPRIVVEWFDKAMQGGRITGVDVNFVGPLSAFPFDDGGGMFRATLDVEDGVLAFIEDWPRAENLDGTVEFVNASFAARGGGRVLGNESNNVEASIEDLRSAVLKLRSDTTGPLADVLRFLQDSPLIARHLGPAYARLAAPAGTGNIALDLSLPLLDLPAYEVTAALDILDGELVIDGFAPRATGIDGRLTFADGAVTGDGIKAVFLDGPVTARVLPPQIDGYRAKLEVNGEVTADAAAAAFDLPLADLVAGQTLWEGDLLIPAQAETGVAVAPLRVSVASNLSGVALNLPPPFAKGPAEPTNLQVDFVHEGDSLEVQGHVGATRRFLLSFASAGEDAGLKFDRGSLRFGGTQPTQRSAPGLTVDGTLPTLHFDDWLALARSTNSEAARGRTLAGSGLGDLFTEADLDVTDFSVFGQQLGSSQLNVRREFDEWLIDIDSAAVAGAITVPRNLRNRPAIVADMERLYLTPVEGVGVGRIDPRKLLGLSLNADEFAFGQRRLGSLRAEVEADPVGLRLVSFESGTEHFTVAGSGGWFEGVGGPTTRLAFSLNSTDVAQTLSQLGLEPMAAGEMADITASVHWPGAPSVDWTQHLGGDVAMRLETGSLLDLDPGAGRVVGLMSISALPRRLALDFRDVFNKGLVFDEIGGDFTIVDGNAFTDNLKVTGPVAEIGVAGRIGLRDRDYRQQAVVTAEPGKMLPTVGGLIGGPGVGAALLIFTRIFKEPLKGIGRASYCVTGSWEAPSVERLTTEQLEKGELCAELPPGSVSMLQ